jgi:hypothetical protein
MSHPMFRYVSGEIVRQGDHVDNCGHDAEVTFVDPNGLFAPQLGPGFMIREPDGVEIFITHPEPCLVLRRRGRADIVVEVRGAGAHVKSSRASRPEVEEGE